MSPIMLISSKGQRNVGGTSILLVLLLKISLHVILLMMCIIVLLLLMLVAMPLLLIALMLLLIVLMLLSTSPEIICSMASWTAIWHSKRSAPSLLLLNVIWKLFTHCNYCLSNSQSHPIPIHHININNVNAFFPCILS